MEGNLTLGGEYTMQYTIICYRIIQRNLHNVISQGHSMNLIKKRKLKDGKYISWNSNHIRARVAISILDKIDFKTINISREKEGNILSITGSVHLEDIPITHAHLNTNLNQRMGLCDSHCNSQFSPWKQSQ